VKIHETEKDDGAIARVFLLVEDGVISISSDEDSEGCPVALLALPEGAIDAVMKRYGAPLDPSQELIPVDTLDLGDGCALHHVRHLARYDVIARDFLVYEAHEREPVCALATTIAGALSHLARVNDITNHS
jgi:hypothetical protein